jgi:hypothetical protein
MINILKETCQRATIAHDSWGGGQLTQIEAEGGGYPTRDKLEEKTTQAVQFSVFYTLSGS